MTEKSSTETSHMINETLEATQFSWAAIDKQGNLIKIDNFTQLLTLPNF